MVYMVIYNPISREEMKIKKIFKKMAHAYVFAVNLQNMEWELYECDENDHDKKKLMLACKVNRLRNDY